MREHNAGRSASLAEQQAWPPAVQSLPPLPHWRQIPVKLSSAVSAQTADNTHGEWRA